jgi:leucyl aminopeptidase
VPQSPDVKLAKAAPAGATAVAVPVFVDRLNKVEGVRRAVLDRAGFRGRPGDQLTLEDGERTRVLVGLGAYAEAGAADLRRAAACFARAVSRHRRAAFDYPLDLPGVEDDLGVRAVTEGLLLGAYRFDTYRSASEATGTAFHVVVDDRARALRPALERGVVTAESVCFARDLVNEPGGTLTPTVFAERAAERARDAGLDVEVLDEEAIAREGLGGLIAVNQGSVEPPRLLKLTYEPAMPAGTVALVGKGITFDSGGLSIKPADGMMDMKCDMAGAAAVIAAMTALPALGVGVRVVSFTPMTDNMTGGAAQRPGDVYTAKNGTTVEVLNTDAEGRLILADALSLAAEEEPDAIIDLATLTGACIVALGNRIAGAMGNDDEFVRLVVDSADRAGERMWHLPLPSDYRTQLDSSVADLKNIGGGRYGGALTAGLFLKEFVPDGTPWAHLDIAGPAFQSEVDGEHPKGGTGFGVRTLLELLEQWGSGDEDDVDPDVEALGTA